ncbi:unnamed protein product, partial [Polarella glacialis]
ARWLPVFQQTLLLGGGASARYNHLDGSIQVFGGQQMLGNMPPLREALPQILPLLEDIPPPPAVPEQWQPQVPVQSSWQPASGLGPPAGGGRGPTAPRGEASRAQLCEASRALGWIEPGIDPLIMRKMSEGGSRPV